MSIYVKTRCVAIFPPLIMISLSVLYAPLSAHAKNPYIDIDPDLGLAKIPDLMSYNPDSNKIMVSIMLVMLLIALFYCAREYLKHKDILPMTIAISSILICIPEVFVDIMGAVFYLTSEHDYTFTLLGRRMSWFPVVAWFGYGAVFINLFLKCLESKTSTRNIWILILAAAATEALIEELLLFLGGVYFYYGNQPLVLFNKLPYWWLPCNVGGVFLAAAIAFYYREKLGGWRSLFMIAITPCSMAAAYALIALPSWIVVNGNHGWLMTQAAGALTVVLGFAAFAMEINIFLKRNPFDYSYRPDAAIGQNRIFCGKNEPDYTAVGKEGYKGLKSN